MTRSTAPGPGTEPPAARTSTGVELRDAVLAPGPEPTLNGDLRRGRLRIGDGGLIAEPKRLDL
ncbi:MAG: hypothetical protein QOG76_3604, partial [Pseudonocardiales bacterium]|nr:hypothetical protein [Pseudonocardiales bacterium]